MKVINLTQHNASQAQLHDGVFDPPEKYKECIKELLTFTQLPIETDIRSRATALATLASLCDADAAMIGGAPWLMSRLEDELKKQNIKPVYAFSQRVVVETPSDDGSVVKRAVFKHLGFVDA